MLRVFLLTSGVIFGITGLAKVLSATGSSEILGTPDPVFEVSFRFLFAVAGTVELIVSALCLFVSNIALRILSVAWLSSVLQGYRFVAAWIRYKSFCLCSGTLPESIDVRPSTADLVMRG